MGAKLLFSVSAIKPLVEHAKAAKKHRKLCGQKKATPGLLLAKDDGIYLMSSGLPILADNKDGSSTTSRVVYARGFDPYKGDDVWSKASEVSGDDFCELVPLSHFLKPIERGAKEITVTLTESDVIVEYDYPVKPKGNVAKKK